MSINIKRIMYKIIFISPLLLSILNLINSKFTFILFFTLSFIFFINLDYIKRKKFISLLFFDSFLIVDLLYGIIKLNNFLYFQEYDFVTYSLLISFLFYWNDKDNIKKYNEIIESMSRIPNINAIITTILLFYSLFIGLGFVAKHQTIVFTGIYGLEHELAYHLLCSHALLMFAEKELKYDKVITNIFKIVFSVFIILTGVRTALLILILLFFIDFKNMKLQYKLIICLILCLGFGFISTNSNLIAKIPLISKSTISKEAGDVTNGRFVMSERGIDYYLNKTSSTEKIHGITMTNLRNKVFWDGLHAHNDFVNILLGFGALNLLYFVYLLLKIKEITKIEFLLLLIVTALFNGLFMYYEFVLSIPLFVELTKKDGEKI